MDAVHQNRQGMQTETRADGQSAHTARERQHAPPHGNTGGKFNHPPSNITYCGFN